LSSDFLFKALVDHSLTGILIITRERIKFANRMFQEMTGYRKEDIDSMSPWDMVHPAERETVRNMGMARFRNERIKNYYETRWIKKDGSELNVEVRVAVIPWTDEPELLANVIDITERKKVETELKCREEALTAQSRELEETNIALRVLLRQQNQGKKDLQDNLLFNVEQLIVPYLERLERHTSDARQETWLKVIKSNLADIISPHLRRLSDRMQRLTNKEIHIANLIKQGKSTKEIAAMLFVCKATIDFHRHNIRKKLDLIHHKINLRTFLSESELEADEK
jgi:PAS domain S-box-containing protein